MTQLPESLEGATPAETIWALVRPFGSNVFQLFSWPESHIVDVSVALRRSGRAASPVAIGEDGVPGALLSFSDEDYEEGDLAAYVEALHGAGINAYGYQLVHDHEILDVDFFQRVGPVPISQGEAPLFIYLQHLDDTNETGAVVIFGDPARLADLVRFVNNPDGPVTTVDSVDPLDGPEGVSSVSLKIDHGLVPRASELLERLQMQGFALHFRSFKA